MKRVRLMSLGLPDQIFLPCLIGGAMAITALGCSGGKSAPPPPSINTITSYQGQAGSSFLISGALFTNVISVTVGGIEVRNFNILDDNAITAWVSSDAKTGVIAVASPWGTAQSSSNFYVVPVITGLTSTTDPTGGATMNPGDAVTITGSGFIGATSVHFVGPPSTPIGTPANAFTVVNANQITTSVPAGLPSGAGYTLAVIVPGPNGGTISSGSNLPPSPLFTVNN